MGLLDILALGFLLGMRHATDADHVVATATLVSQDRRLGAAARVGALWGLGHSVALLTVGGAIIGLRLALPTRLGLTLELLVAVMLLVLGARNLVSLFQHRALKPRPPRGKLQSIFIGLVHGLAGSAAAALLVLTTIHETTWALAYLALFATGTVAGMVVITSLMAVPAALSKRGIERPLTWISGTLSVALGLFLFYRVGIVDGLFTHRATWSSQ